MNQVCLVVLLFLFIEITVGENTCLYNGKKYNNGEVTSSDDCKTCSCGVFGIYCLQKPCRDQVTCKMKKNINTNIPETCGVITKTEDECVNKCQADSKCRVSKYNVLERFCQLASDEVLNKTYFEFGVHIFIKDCTVNRLLQYYPAPPTSCRNVTSTEPRFIVTLTSGLKVMCDTKTDGGGWIIIQRRINGNVDFFRGWKEYREGFGDYNIGEFYLGNENIFKLTSSGRYDLRIDLEYNNKTYFAQYEDFKVLSETEKYKLQIGNYKGNAGDSLRRQNDMFFSTFDEENDIDNIDNCALRYLGAWWYKDCHDSNLNGQWGNKLFGKGLNWYGLTQWTDSVTFSEMKIRERD